MEKFSPDTNSSEANRVIPALDKVIQFSLFTFAVFSMFSISVTQISFAIGALAWLFKIHLTKSWKELRGTRVGIAILFFCLACVLAVATSVDLESSIKPLKKLLQFVIFFWVANAVQDEKQRDLLIGLVIVAGAVTALNGLFPFWAQGYYSPQRLLGTMSMPSTLSGVLMLAGLIALGRFLFHKPKEYWVLGSLGIISLCLLLTLTRQAWLGFFTGTVFLLFFRSKKYLLILPLLLAGLLLFAPAGLKDRVFTMTDMENSGLQVRMSLWKGGWEIFKDHPVTGCGFKCVDSIHSQYPDPSGYVARIIGMHNNVLQLLVDTGVVGLGTWLSIWATYFIEIFKHRWILHKETSQGNVEGLLLGSLAAVLGFIVGGFFETNIYDSEVAMLLYFLMGLSLTQVKKAPRAE